MAGKKRKSVVSDGESDEVMELDKVMQETPANSDPVFVHFTSTGSRYVNRQPPLNVDSGDHSDEYSDADIYDGFGPSILFIPLGTHQPLHEWIHSNGHCIGPFNLSSPAHLYEVQFAMYTFGKEFPLSEFLVKIRWVTVNRCDMASLVLGKYVHGLVISCYAEKLTLDAVYAKRHPIWFLPTRCSEHGLGSTVQVENCGDIKLMEMYSRGTKECHCVSNASRREKD